MKKNYIDINSQKLKLPILFKDPPVNILYFFLYNITEIEEFQSIKPADSGQNLHKCLLRYEICSKEKGYATI